jgi:Na+-translocating ferredoxin:NAD+ oxidoreductase subunit D
MENKFYISLAPHIHGGDSIEKKMYGVLLALLPAFLVSLYVFGWGAFILTGVSVVSCMLFEFLIQKYLMKVKPTVMDGSAMITGVLLAFNVPSNLPLWMMVIGALIAIGVAKMSFGGLGNNPFNPAIVGRVFLLISFPVQMTSWPLAGQHLYPDALTGATTLQMLKGHFGTLPDLPALLIGNIGGSLGEIGAIALIIGGLYLLFRKIITWHIPLTMLGTVFVFSFAVALLNPSFCSLGQTPLSGNLIASALHFSLIHLLSGGLLLGAFFMATDYVTSPMTRRGQWIYAFGIGLITCLIRFYGSYPEGVSFGIFIMNAVTPLINMYVKPKRFGEVRK